MWQDRCWPASSFQQLYGHHPVRMAQTVDTGSPPMPVWSYQLQIVSLKIRCWEMQSTKANLVTQCKLRQCLRMRTTCGNGPRPFSLSPDYPDQPTLLKSDPGQRPVTRPIKKPSHPIVTCAIITTAESNSTPQNTALQGTQQHTHTPKMEEGLEMKQACIPHNTHKGRQAHMHACVVEKQKIT